MADATFKALVVTGKPLATYVLNDLLGSDPIVHDSWRTNWFTTLRRGYRFGASEKQSTRITEARGRINRPSRIVVRARGQAPAPTQFIFDPDNTGKIFLIAEANWHELLVDTDEAPNICTLIYYHGANAHRLTAETGMGMGAGLAFLTSWANSLKASHNYLAFNDVVAYQHFIHLAPGAHGV